MNELQPLYAIVDSETGKIKRNYGYNTKYLIYTNLKYANNAIKKLRPDYKLIEYIATGEINE